MIDWLKLLMLIDKFLKMFTRTPEQKKTAEKKKVDDEISKSDSTGRPT